MSSVEKISVAVTADMLAMVRKAVASGDYASTSEVVREALRQWKAGRLLTDAPSLTAAAPRGGRSTPANSVKPGQTLIQTHREAIAALCRRYQVHRLTQFGSVVRTDFDPSRSDVDFVVEFADSTDRSSARQYFDFKTALEKLLGRDVDLLELSAMPDSRLRRLIERTQVLLYGEAA